VRVGDLHFFSRSCDPVIIWFLVKSWSSPRVAVSDLHLMMKRNLCSKDEQTKNPGKKSRTERTCCLPAQEIRARLFDESGVVFLFSIP